MIKSFREITRRNKLWVTLRNGKNISFSSSKCPDFLIHKDKARRERYRRRASKIKDKYGNLTYKNPNSVNYWSFYSEDEY